jgi:hypothetical protein
VSTETEQLQFPVVGDYEYQADSRTAAGVTDARMLVMIDAGRGKIARER